MSMAALTWAFDRKMTDPTAKAVLVALANHAGDDWRCYPGIARLELCTALSDRAIQGAIIRLESEGAIRVIRSPGKVSVYELVRTCAVTPEPASPPKEVRGERRSPHPRTTFATPPKEVRGNHQGTQINPAAVVGARALDAVRAAWPDLDSRIELPGLAGSLGMLQAWLADGADLDRDILPTITRICCGLQSKGRGPPRNFSYFRQAVADTKATNEQGLPHGQPTPSRSSRQQPARFKNGFAELVYADLHGAPGDRKPGVVMDMPDPDQPADPGDRRRLAART